MSSFIEVIKALFQLSVKLINKELTKNAFLSLRNNQGMIYSSLPLLLTNYIIFLSFIEIKT